MHTCVRVSRVYTVREAQSAIWQAHDSRRDVWSAISFGTCWQLVVLFLINVCIWSIPELWAGVLCRAYTERPRSPVVCIVFRHGQSTVACRSVAQADRHADPVSSVVELVFGSACCRTHLRRHGQHPIRILFLRVHVVCDSHSA